MPAVDEVACELSVGYGVSEESVHSRIWEARQLCRRLRLTWEALFDGRFSSYAARQVVEAADLLDDDAEAARLEQLVVPRGSHDLTRRLRRAVHRVNPEAARRRSEEKRLL